MKPGKELVCPMAWEDVTMTRFCSFMLSTARTQDGKRLIRDFVAHERTEALAAHGSTEPSTTKPFLPPRAE